MKKIYSLFFTLILTYTIFLSLHAQCSDPSSNYSFTHENHGYAIVKENKTWLEAAACAVELGGYLTEINDEAEQVAIFSALTNDAAIIKSATANQFGWGSVWIGGNDFETEGYWIWDGNNDGVGPQFWLGGVNGNSVGGLYNNWGNEPDNSGGQDALSMLLEDSPVSDATKWNDLKSSSNFLYYVIEFDMIPTSQNQNELADFTVSPNPFNDFLSIKSDNKIQNISFFNLLGQPIMNISGNILNPDNINVSKLLHGMYILKVEFVTGQASSIMIIK